MPSGQVLRQKGRNNHQNGVKRARVVTIMSCIGRASRNCAEHTRKGRTSLAGEPFVQHVHLRLQLRGRHHALFPLRYHVENYLHSSRS